MNIVLWVACVERVDVGEQEEIGSVVHGCCYRPEGVIIPYLDLLHRITSAASPGSLDSTFYLCGYRVVLVDDWHHAH
jgi:hypothetical protein